METKTKLIVALLVVAILFSVFSIVLNLSLLDFKPVANQPAYQVIYHKVKPVGTSQGNLQLFIEGGAPSNEGE